jgi:PAS domain S-box-containing protein
MLVDIEVSVNYMRDEEQMFVFLRDITERKRAEKVQEAIYKISQAAVSTASLEELYRSVHNILGALMTVENFYIALYDPASDMLSFPYFVDQYDRPSLPQKPRRGLTEYILRTGKPLLAPPEVFNQLLQQGEVELVGTNSLDWLGVPLKVGKRMIGVMVTQSYTEKTRFSQKELELLEFVSTQVASAIERKQAEEALRESEQKYKALVETTETGFLILDTEGRVVDANAEYVRLTGHKTLNEILGRTVMEWTAPYDRERNAVEVEKCATTGAVRDLVIDYAGPNGVITPVEINATVVQMAGSTRILSLCRDITARKQTEQLVLTQRDLGLALGTLSDLEQGLRLCLEAAQSVSLMDCGGIYLVDEMTSALNLVVHQGLSPDFIRSVSHYAADSANARLVMAGKPIYTEYFALGVPIDEASQREGLHAIAVIPIQHEGRVIGCLNVASHTRDAVPVFARTALEAVVTQIANVTMRMQAEERVRRNAARAEALAHTAARLNAQLDLDAVLNAVCEETARALNVPATSVTLYDEKREEFEHAATFGMPPAYRARAKPFPRRLFDKYAAQMGPVIVGADVQAILGLPNADLYQALAIRMMVGVTMQRDGRLIGGLNLFTFHQVRHFDDDELALLKGLADQAALAIANARLHDEVRRHAAELEQKVAERTAELSQREAALRAANEQLQQLSRMKSEFVSNVSHELRTPLANIMTYLWLLDHGKPEKHTQYVETLHRESDLLERLIEDLLHLSRLDLGTVQPVLAPVDVNQVVTLLVSDRALLFANRGLTLEARTAPNLPLIQADEKMLIQVLTNLMTNAMNYTPAGGAVTVSTAVRISDFGFRISDSAGDSPQSRCAGREQSAIPLRGTQAVRNLQWVTFSVADTGPGISAEDRVRLFERFYRGEAARQTRTPGTGLGLAICQELVERHGGKITVESEVGQGSTFTVWLPVKGDAVTG